MSRCGPASSRSRATSTSSSTRRIVRSTGDDTDLEGCLSIPGYVAYVTRREKVWVVAQDRRGRAYKVAGSGLLGRALQHELDHLDGKLYIDYLDSMDDLIAVGHGDDDDEDGPDGGRRPDRGRHPRGDARPRLTERARVVFLGSGAFAVPILERLLAEPGARARRRCRGPRSPGRPRGEPSGRCPSSSLPATVASTSSSLPACAPPRRSRRCSPPARAGRPGRLRPDRAGRAPGDAAPRGMLNLHPSLLPRHRGRDADPGGDPGRRRRTGRQPVPDGCRPRQRPDHRPGCGSRSTAPRPLPDSRSALAEVAAGLLARSIGPWLRRRAAGPPPAGRWRDR